MDINAQLEEKNRQIKALLKENTLLKEILRVMPGHVYWVNRKGVYLGCNENQAKSACLKSPQEIVGKRNRDLPWNFYTDSLPEELDKTNLEVMRTGSPKTLIEYALLQDGKEAVFLSHKIPLHNPNNQVIGMAGISVDITDRHCLKKDLQDAREEIRTLNHDLMDLSQSVHFDLSSHIEGLQKLFHLAQQESDAEKMKVYLNEIDKALERLLGFSESFFGSLKMDVGKHPLLQMTFNLKEQLEALQTIYQPKTRIKPITFHIHLDKKIPLFLEGDIPRIITILVELLDNAFKFTEQGTVTLRADLVQPAPNLIVAFSVADTGSGIPRPQRRQLFIRHDPLPFEPRRVEGGGLGLLVVKQMMYEINGKIEYRKVKPHGAYFSCLIPLRASLIQEPSKRCA